MSRVRDGCGETAAFPAPRSDHDRENASTKCAVVTTLDGPAQQCIVTLVDQLESGLQMQDWETLRQSLDDPSLSEVAASSYIYHMQIIHAQMLHSALAKEIGSALFFLDKPNETFSRFVKLSRPIGRVVNPENALFRKYNQAFGQSLNESILAMVRVLEHELCPGRLRPTTIDALDYYLMAVFAAMSEALARVITPSPKSDH